MASLGRFQADLGRSVPLHELPEKGRRDGILAPSRSQSAEVPAHAGSTGSKKGQILGAKPEPLSGPERPFLLRAVS